MWEMGDEKLEKGQIPGKHRGKWRRGRIPKLRWGIALKVTYKKQEKN